MAKKNSTKTATKEAIQDAIPRIQTFTAWKGIDIQNIPIDAEIELNSPQTPAQWVGKAQSDAQAQTLAIQNNISTASNGTLWSRYETIKLKDSPNDYTLTGVALNFDEYVYCAVHEDVSHIYRFKLPSDEWEAIALHDDNPVVSPKTKKTEIKSMLVFQSKFLLLTQVTITEPGQPTKVFGEMYEGNMDTLTTNGLRNAIHVDEPTEPPEVDLRGINNGDVARLRFAYVYCNKFGSTMQGTDTTTTVNVDTSPVEYSSAKYIQLSGAVPTNQNITGVDLYCTMNESQDYIFIGHVTIEEDQSSWVFPWLGAMMDTSQWTTSSLTLPVQNTTDGVDACYMDQYDGRLYFYGGSEKYRLYIGGNPGSELSISTGLGGAFVDIEPGSGQEIRKVLKFKTYNGATVVTLLTYHPNTSKSSRYNLLETEITVTNEYSAKGYDYEKVDSVLGVSSYYGADTFIDGLYAVNRYGLAFTTKVQENQNNLRIMYCSDAIKPIFEGLYGYQVNESRLLCINDIVYLCLAKERIGNELSQLENIIFCYDTTAKAWYTYTLEGLDSIRHIIQIDCSKFTEGIGIITDDSIQLIPTTGDDFKNYYRKDGDKYTTIPNYPKHDTYIETHELAIRTPVTNLFYCNQLEINFDSICCPEGIDIWIEGYDHYGRHFKINKHIIEKYLQRYSNYYMRVDRYVKSFRLFIRGKAHYRLTHINMKCFQQSSSIGNAYGFDTWHRQKKQHDMENYKHHQLNDYNNLKEIIMT